MSGIIPNATTKAHRLSLLAGIKATETVPDSAFVKGAEAFNELLAARAELRSDIRKIEESLRGDG